MVDCSQFLEGYSDFRDGELDDEVRSHFEWHLAECTSCARYDRVISTGVQLYRRLPEITPSDDFLPRLQHRLYHIDEEMRGPGRSGSGVQAALTLAIAATIAAIAWVPATRSAPTVLELPPVAARAPLPPPPSSEFSETRFFTPAGVGLGNWSRLQQGPSASDLFFQHPASGSRFQVQPVMQH